MEDLEHHPTVARAKLSLFGEVFILELSNFLLVGEKELKVSSLRVVDVQLV